MEEKMVHSESDGVNRSSLVNKRDGTSDKKLETDSHTNYNKTTPKPEMSKNISQKEDYKASGSILDYMKKNYSKKAEKVDKFKDRKKNKKTTAAMTQKPYREVIRMLINSGNVLSESMLNAKKESVKLLNKTKSQTRICTINQDIKESLTKLGREIYDLFVLGVTDVLKYKSIVKIIGSINELYVEKELICKKFYKKSK